MKNILLVFILIFIIGCGFFNKKDLNDTLFLSDEEIVDLNDTNGIYDLSDYLFPKKTKSYVYEVNTSSKDSNGLEENRLIEITDDYFSIAENHIQFGDNTNYFIRRNVILKQEFFNGFYEVRYYRRHLNLNDVYFSYEQTKSKDNYLEVGKMVCTLVSHENKMEILNVNYDDVIRLKCEGFFREGVLNVALKTTKFTIDYFYAKNKGLVFSKVKNTESNNNIESSYSYTTIRTKKIIKKD